MTENNICGCCLSEDYHRDIHNEYVHCEQKEMYEEMLLNTFNINIIKPESINYICKNCIVKLQESMKFKQQVINAQQTINNRINNTNMLHMTVESIENFDDKLCKESSENDFEWDDRLSQKGQVYVIKLEPKDGIPEVKAPIKKVPRSAAKKLQNLQNVKITRKNSDVPKSRNSSHVKVAKNSTKSIKGNTKRQSINYEMSPITQTELDARDNTLKLIQHSNLCLFRSLKTKFGCFMCKNAFVDTSKLREHSSTHTNKSFLAYRISKWRGLSYKNADISNLKCIKCSDNISNLSELGSHLKDKHEITLSGNGHHFLIPYKLTDENICAMCNTKFNTFLRLSIHMNTHYTNNVCEICGRSFINRTSLRTHAQSMHREKKCSHCPAKFLTGSARITHLKRVHNVFNLKRYCNLCEKTFPYTYLLVKHKIEEHGAKKTVINCNDCGKTFFHEANLRVHVRSVHKRERNYPCDVCGTRFFTKCDQKRHEKTHNDVRSFSCDYCDSKFKSKDSWRRHMKRQHSHVFK